MKKICKATYVITFLAPVFLYTSCTTNSYKNQDIGKQCEEDSHRLPAETPIANKCEALFPSTGKNKKFSDDYLANERAYNSPINKYDGKAGKSLQESVTELAEMQIRLNDLKLSGKSAEAKTLAKEIQDNINKAKDKFVKTDKALTEESFNQMLKDQVRETKLKAKQEERRIAKREVEVKRYLENVDTKYHQEHVVMYKVVPENFKMKSLGLPHTDVELTEPFYVSSTPVTELNWVKINLLGGADNTVAFDSSNKPSLPGVELVEFNRPYTVAPFKKAIRPHFPKTELSVPKIQDFLERLNRLSKFGTPETQRELRDIIPGHEQGRFYTLGTAEQQKFVRTNLGKANEKFYDKADATEITDYAWIAKNSGGVSHRVATRKPRLIDFGNGKEQPMFDLEGNVAEWSLSKWSNENRGYEDATVIIQGGDYTKEAKDLEYGKPQPYSPYPSDKVGIRLFAID